MAEKDVVEILKELVDELNKMADEKSKSIPGAAGAYQVLYYEALAAGIYEACYKVIEKKDEILKARADGTKRKEWAERIEAREQEIMYNRINGGC